MLNYNSINTLALVSVAMVLLMINGIIPINHLTQLIVTVLPTITLLGAITVATINNKGQI